MLELAPTTFFLLPVAVGVGIIFALWLYYDHRRLDDDAQSGTGRMIYRCEHCQHVYVEQRMYPLLECPRCRHPNPAVRR